MKTDRDSRLALHSWREVNSQDWLNQLNLFQPLARSAIAPYHDGEFRVEALTKRSGSRLEDALSRL
jgi:hypothetical protein